MNGEILKKKIFLDLRGGLANQLFQWATVSIWAEHHGYQLVIKDDYVSRPGNPGNQLKHLVDIKPRRKIITDAFLWQVLFAVAPRKIYYKLNWSTGHIKNPFVKYAGSLIELDQLWERKVRVFHARGLFQNSDYLADWRTRIRDVLIPALRRYGQNLEFPFGGIHVRRGDYVTDKEILAAFGSCTENYYKGAIDKMKPNLPLFVFTDDRQWAQETFLKTFKGKEIALSPQGNHFKDLYALSCAKEIVMANSTFSWWAYFLSDAELVFAPSPWFDDKDHDQNLTGQNWTFLGKTSGELLSL